MPYITILWPILFVMTEVIFIPEPDYLILYKIWGR